MTALEIVPVASSAPATASLPDPRPFKLPEHLSFSALSSYAECGEKWRLERGYGIQGPTWWNTLGGTAVHEVTEMVDRVKFGEDVEVQPFAHVFERVTAEELEKGGWTEADIKPSGRKTKDWPNGQDRDWWYVHGPLYVSAWIRWRESSNLRLWETPWGSPGIEVPIEAMVAGRKFKAFIDRVFMHPNGRDLTVVDLKAGNHEPKSVLQLGSYKIGMLRDYGENVVDGGFWMAKNHDKDGDGLKYMEPLDRFTPEFVDAQYDMAWRGIMGGIFLPSPSNFCGSCSVRQFCALMGGSRADELPVLEQPAAPAELEASAEVKQITSD